MLIFRSVTQIQRMKNEFIQSYALMQPHLEKLDIIFKSDKENGDTVCENLTQKAMATSIPELKVQQGRKREKCEQPQSQHIPKQQCRDRKKRDT